MSAVCVLTPIVVASWPGIASAIAGAAASMGFSMQTARREEEQRETRVSVETEIEESEILADETVPGHTIVIERGDVTIEFGQDERGACKVCVSGSSHTHPQLRRIGEEIAGRVVQQFAYHRLISELKRRDYTVVEEEVLRDESVRIHIRG